MKLATKPHLLPNFFLGNENIASFKLFSLDGPSCITQPDLSAFLIFVEAQKN